MFAAIVRFIREWKRYNQALNELSQLGDRELADIGISRSDNPRIAWDACAWKLATAGANTNLACSPAGARLPGPIRH